MKSPGVPPKPAPKIPQPKTRPRPDFPTTSPAFPKPAPPDQILPFAIYTPNDFGNTPACNTFKPENQAHKFIDFPKTNHPPIAQKMKTILIEDEPQALNALQFNLAEHCPDVAVAGSAASVPRAVELIRAERPELIFLDLELSGQLGFEVLEQVGLLDFGVIYTTAHAELMEDAWHYGGLDFLKKPIAAAQLRRAVEKARDMLRQKKLFSELEARGRQPLLPLVVASATETEFVTLDRIRFCRAARSSCELFLGDGSRRVVSHPVGHLEKQLAPHGFLRIHNSLIVNTVFVRKYLPGRKGAAVELLGGEQLELGDTFRPAFKAWVLRANLV